MQRYKMLRVREEDYDKLRDAQRLMQQKGLESINWGALQDQRFIEPPPAQTDPNTAAVALTLGFVIGVGAAAIAALIAKGIAESAQDKED